MSGPPTRIARERRDRAGGGGGLAGGVPHSSAGEFCIWSSKKSFLAFSSYKQGVLAPRGGGGVLSSEAEPHPPEEKKTGKGGGRGTRNGVEIMRI